MFWCKLALKSGHRKKGKVCLSHGVVFYVVLSNGAAKVEQIETTLFTDCQKLMQHWAYSAAHEL